MAPIPPQQARSVARALACTRIVIGTSAVLAPARLVRPWIGRDAALPAATVLSRCLGARDLAIGLGAVLAMRHDAPVRGWIEAGGMADAADLVATLMAFPSLPRTSRWVVAAAAGAAVATAQVVARSID